MKRKMLIMIEKEKPKRAKMRQSRNHDKNIENKTKSALTSWRIRLKWTSCFLKLTTSCSMAFLSDLSTTRSSDDELSSCECKFNCWRCLRCSLRDVFDGVLRLCRLSNDRGLSDPFWLRGELLLVCRRRLSRRVARAGSWDLRIKFNWRLLIVCPDQIKSFPINTGKLSPTPKNFILFPSTAFLAHKKSIESNSVTHKHTTSIDSNSKSRNHFAKESLPTIEKRLAWSV